MKRASAAIIAGSSWKAPVKPVSSSTVNSASTGGSLAPGGRSSTASAAQTPIPLSAPSVVPAAPTQSPSAERTSSSASFMKSCARCECFSLTMSTCP